MVSFSPSLLEIDTAVLVGDIGGGGISSGIPQERKNYRGDAGESRRAGAGGHRSGDGDSGVPLPVPPLGSHGWLCGTHLDHHPHRPCGTVAQHRAGFPAHSPSTESISLGKDATPSAPDQRPREWEVWKGVVMEAAEIWGSPAHPQGPGSQREKFHQEMVLAKEKPKALPFIKKACVAKHTAE